MNIITIIGTSHIEGGACTSIELNKIIEKVSPDVIFCEAAPETFQAMLNATERFNTPEIKVLRTIIEKKTIDIIPVDIHEDPFDRRLEAMFELFRKQIREYFYATDIQANETHRLGFPYLNSEDCDQIHRDKNSMEKLFVARVKDYQLSKTHKDWLNWNDERENHWINKIYDCFEKNKIKKGVFLVGSAHRIRLLEKIENFHDSSDLTLNWNFYPFK